ncbi:MAG TPA: alkaline phosphatase family protein [Candidatus Polarisedimenticolia bacterium]|nr:alkaline phosphatase family protein [Candidatus Polarisedimenticolia bacterium]
MHASRPMPPGRLAAASCVLTFLMSPALCRGEAYDKVVVLGFDGVDANLVEQCMRSGRLPNLAHLRETGFYAPLRSTNPPQTPVSWASFSTGLNPGRTEIFDFLRRTEGTYLPEFAMIKEGKQALLFGERNPPILGFLGAIAGGIVTLGLAFAAGRRGRVTFLMSGIAALVVGGTGALIAARYLPRQIPSASNPRKGLPFWAAASRAGTTVKVLNVPATFPAEDLEHGRMLSGLGVPDMRGRIGSPSFYTSDPALTLSDNQFSVEIVKLQGRRGALETHIVGPLNKPFYDYALEEATRGVVDREAKGRLRAAAEKDLAARGVPRRLDVPFRLEASDASLTIDLAGSRQTLRPGDWSDWFVVPIPVNPVVDAVAGLKGIVRFKLMTLSPEIRLYMSPLNFHPTCQPVQFSSPRSFARELWHDLGLFKTLGWPIDTWSLPSGVTDERHFLEDMEATADFQLRMMQHSLDTGHERLYLQVFDFPDRVAHMLWRLHDPGHPLYDASLAAQYADEIPKSYERMDRIVGEALRRIGPRTALIVCSDHGFASFRRGVNYNTWLVKNGFMTLRPGGSGGKTLEDLFDRGELGEFFQYVDWSRTKAYAMGLGNIYINLLGREPQGSVAPGREYEEVKDAIVTRLAATVDPETGERPVRRVYRREEIYSGFDPRLVPDLRAANNDHYRIGWQTALGEVPPQVFEDNLKAWSGDHCSNDPALVPGVLFSNIRLSGPEPGIADLHPTILALLGVAPVEGIDGRSLAP